VSDRVDARPAARPKVLLVASECTPFAKTGGLADVAGALPKALRRRGIDARVVMPLYRGIPWDALDVLEGALSVPIGGGAVRGRVRLGRLPRSDAPVYFLEHHHYYDREYLYGSPTEAYPDNVERFTFLSRGALQLCRALGWYPDIVHANDWQTALVPVYLNTVEWAQPLHAAASLYTIHNLAYQGVTDRGALFLTGLGREHDNSNEFEHFGTLNLTKAALAHATLITTVSPTYAREIQTPAHGDGLDGVLRGRAGDLFGIVNGIDPEEWNPATDRHLPARFDAGDLRGKAVCKAELQKEAGLPVREDVPLFGLVARLVPQKGTDVLAHAIDRILDLDVQLILLGTGDPEAESFFAEVADERRPLLRVASVPQRARPPHRGRLRLLPHAVALRALRAQPALQSRLRHPADRAGHGRPRGHGARLRRGDGRRHGFLLPRPHPRRPLRLRGLGGVHVVRPASPHRADATRGHGRGLLVAARGGRVREALSARVRAAARARVPASAGARGGLSSAP
jgi:starch synthase